MIKYHIEFGIRKYTVFGYWSNIDLIYFDEETTIIDIVNFFQTIA